MGKETDPQMSIPVFPSSGIESKRPFSFGRPIGLPILIAITTSNFELGGFELSNDLRNLF